MFEIGIKFGSRRVIIILILKFRFARANVARENFSFMTFRIREQDANKILSNAIISAMLKIA